METGNWKLVPCAARRIGQSSRPLDEKLIFNADCRFRIAMTPEDLAKAGLEALGKKWA